MKLSSHTPPKSSPQTLQVPSFEEAIKQMRYPRIENVPLAILSRIFEIATKEGLNIEKVAQKIAEVINETHGKVHGVMNHTSSREVLEYFANRNILSS